jgi:hypothetical protein
MQDNELEGFREYELLPLVRKLLPNFLRVVEVYTAPEIGAPSLQPLQRTLRPDFVASLEDGRTAIVEVKGVTPNTRRRLEDAANQLAVYRMVYSEANPTKSVVLALVTPGTLSPEYRRFLHEAGIDQVIDGEDLHRSENLPIINMFMQAARGELPSGPEPSDPADVLVKKLREIPAGQTDWSKYQKLCERILEFLFCPPLEKPIYERSNLVRSDRRDIILPNYVTDSGDFWSQMRQLYLAHFVVVDAKNWSSPIDKGEILKIANYLQTHGAGRFGMIMSRKGADDGAGIALRETWRTDQKMIVVLDDAEVEQMLSLRGSGGNPARVIRQKIEDFRLSF